MRPPILYPLFSPVTSLPGIGPRIGKLIERLAGPFLVDLLWHLPSGIIDRSYRPKLAEAEVGRIATVTVRIEEHAPARTPRLPYRIRCRDDTGLLELIYFHVQGDYLKRLLPVGETRVVNYVRTTQNLPHGKKVTVEVHCDDVPGGVVSHSASETDASGRVIRRSTLELINFSPPTAGIGEAAAPALRRPHRAAKAARRDSR